MFNLAINTGFAVNRYVEPESWVHIVGKKLGLKRVQLTADLINPVLPDKTIQSQLVRIKEASEKYSINISSTFTGALTRVNHLAHPDKDIQEYWIEWFKRFVDITVDVGAKSMGSHFGIFTMKDDRNKILRKKRRKENISNWHEVALYAKQKGIKFLTWEPMSISREQGETLNECRKLLKDVNYNSPLPFELCLDPDHGDWSSSDQRDTDPYAWLKEFAKDSPQVHLKQSKYGQGENKVFTRKLEQDDRIDATKVLSLISKGGRNKVELILEHNFREREPEDSNVIEQLKGSADYWKEAIDKFSS